MSFCVNCGTKLRDDMHFCPKCGTPVGGQAAPQKQPEADTAQCLIKIKVSDGGYREVTAETIVAPVLQMIQNKPKTLWEGRLDEYKKVLTDAVVEMSRRNTQPLDVMEISALLARKSEELMKEQQLKSGKHLLSIRLQDGQISETTVEDTVESTLNVMKDSFPAVQWDIVKKEAEQLCTQVVLEMVQRLGEPLDVNQVSTALVNSVEQFLKNRQQRVRSFRIKS